MTHIDRVDALPEPGALRATARNPDALALAGGTDAAALTDASAVLAALPCAVPPAERMRASRARRAKGKRMVRIELADADLAALRADAAGDTPAALGEAIGRLLRDDPPAGQAAVLVRVALPPDWIGRLVALDFLPAAQAQDHDAVRAAFVAFATEAAHAGIRPVHLREYREPPVFALFGGQR